jgi:hypothetical protein
MARPNGVVIVSERRWAFAGVDGSLREGRMPNPPEMLQRLPLARGLVRLWASLAPVLRPGGVAPSRERWLILTAVIAPLALAFVAGWWSTAAGIALSLVLLFTILRGRALHLHGAEHRSIAAVEERRLTSTWTGAARPRASRRAAVRTRRPRAAVTFAADRLLPLAPAFWSPLVVLVLSLALTMGSGALSRPLRVASGRRSSCPGSRCSA